MASLGSWVFITFVVLFGPTPSTHAQSAYNNLNLQSVTINLSVLDRLGPAPTVPDSRFVLRVAPRNSAAKPVRRIASRSLHHRHFAARGATHSKFAHTEQNSIKRIGNITIDYSALAPVARAAAVRATAARAAPEPQAAALAASMAQINPAAAPVGAASLRPAGGALAATLPAMLPPVGAKSDSSTLAFAPGTADLRSDDRTVLDLFALRLSAKHERVQLVAYASGGAGIDEAIQARRISLARGIAVRAYLIQHGVPSGRIYVRVMGNHGHSGGLSDRVDLVMLDSDPEARISR